VVIVLEPQPSDVPVGVRLKRLLKYAGRGLALKCVHIGHRDEREVVYVERPKRKKVAP
jgi:hypothetical protein